MDDPRRDEESHLRSGWVTRLLVPTKDGPGVGGGGKES